MDDPYVKVDNSKTRHELKIDPPNATGVQSSVMVILNKVALYDPANSQSGGQDPGAIYDELGITADGIRCKLGFRVELTAASGKVLYKDYEITLPPEGFEIAGDEYHFEFYETDVTVMEPFMVK